MKIPTVAFALSFLLVAVHPSRGEVPKAEAPDAETVQVKAEIGEVVAAVFKGDIETLAKHTHDRVIAVVGDKETFLAEMKKVFGQLEEQGILLLAVEVGDDVKFYEGETHRFAIIPASITIKVGDEAQPAVAGHQLGVKAKGEEVWKYIDCSALTTEMAREWFLDFPADLEIPKAE